MKIFVVTRTSEKLVIQRSRAGLIRSRLSAILGMIAITLILAYIWNPQIDRIANKTLQFVIISLLLLLVCFVVFFKYLFEKPVVITQAGAVFALNNKPIAEVKAIEAILVESHVTADTGITIHVKIIVPGRKINIAGGVPASELDELLQNLLVFLGLERTKVKEVVR